MGMVMGCPHIGKMSTLLRGVHCTTNPAYPYQVTLLPHKGGGNIIHMVVKCQQVQKTKFNLPVPGSEKPSHVHLINAFLLDEMAAA